MSTQGKNARDNRSSRENEAYGAASLTQKLQGVRFPIRKEELLRQYGDQKVQWTKNSESLTLRDCLRNAPEEIRSVTQIAQMVEEKSVEKVR